MQPRSLDDPYAIAHDTAEELARNGHVRLPGLLSRDEAAALQPQVAAAVARHYADLAPDERQLYMMGNLWEHDAAVRRIAWSPRLARLAAELLGVPSVRLWRDVAFYKDPGEDATPWHQDRHWEPVDTTRFVGFWIALHDVTSEMGALTYATGSHHAGHVDIPEHEGRAQAGVTSWVAARHAIVSQAPLGAGDATAHLGWTLHSAPPNTSSVRREALSVFYFADGARIATWPADADPIWARVQRHHVALRFPGRAPGDPGVSDRCPVVWPR